MDKIGIRRPIKQQLTTKLNTDSESPMTWITSYLKLNLCHYGTVSSGHYVGFKFQRKILSLYLREVDSIPFYKISPGVDFKRLLD